MEESQESKHRIGGMAGLVTLLLMMPVMYVLSLGPVVWICRGLPVGSTVIKTAEAVYWPLELIHEYDIRPFSVWLNWYVDLFG